MSAEREFPRSVRILGHDVRISIVSDVENEGDEVAGLYDEGNQTILVRANQGADSERETVLHEITHACDEAGHLGLEENQVHAIARMLYAVGRENPHLIRWLWLLGDDK